MLACKVGDKVPTRRPSSEAWPKRPWLKLAATERHLLVVSGCLSSMSLRSGLADPCGGGCYPASLGLRFQSTIRRRRAEETS